jgi:dihydrofolate reductase
MGRKTYEAAKVVPTPDTVRVVMTKHPDRYSDSAVDGQLEFTDESPTEILARYQNHPTCLLLGGGEVYRRFLQDNLVDEIYLTVEPVRFESGTPLFTEKTLDEFLNSFGKITVTDLNSSGTKLYHVLI